MDIIFILFFSLDVKLLEVSRQMCDTTMDWMFVSSPNSHVEILMVRGGGIWRWGLLGVISHKGKALINGISALTKEAPELPNSFVHVRMQWDV